MLWKMYAIFDAKAECYMKPVYARAHNEILRELTRAVEDSKTVFSAAPQDFSVFYIGDFDDDAATVSLAHPKVCLATLNELKREVAKG